MSDSVNTAESSAPEEKFCKPGFMIVSEEMFNATNKQLITELRVQLEVIRLNFDAYQAIKDDEAEIADLWVMLTEHIAGIAQKRLAPDDLDYIAAMRIRRAWTVLSFIYNVEIPVQLFLLDEMAKMTIGELGKQGHMDQMAKEQSAAMKAAMESDLAQAVAEKLEAEAAGKASN